MQIITDFIIQCKDNSYILNVAYMFKLNAACVQYIHQISVCVIWHQKIDVLVYKWHYWVIHLLRSKKTALIVTDLITAPLEVLRSVCCNDNI